MKEFFLKLKSVYFIGIGGISMSALAKYSLLCGLKVFGSDKVDSDIINELTKLGAIIKIGENDLSNISPDLVVYTSAISEDNSELVLAKKINIPIMKRTEYLSQIISNFNNSICVCGCHGKTTVTSMLTHIFMQSSFIPTAFIGGFDYNYSNFFFGEEEMVIAEACEYKKNFLFLQPKTVVCTNIDLDHPDSYSNIDDTINAFKEFCFDKDSVINADDVFSLPLLKNAKLTFGLRNGDLLAKNIIKTESGTYFDVEYKKNILGTIFIRLKGDFNIYNALASIGVSLLYNVDFNTIKNGLEEFRGVKRRLEFVGEKKGLKFYIDYAHHPKEIRASLSAFCDKDTLLVFQPHTYSRTKLLLNDFVYSLLLPKKVVIYKTYPAREQFDIDGDAYTLYSKLKKHRKKVYYADNKQKLFRLLDRKHGKIKRIIFMGAGDINLLSNEYKI